MASLESSTASTFASGNRSAARIARHPEPVQRSSTCPMRIGVGQQRKAFAGERFAVENFAEIGSRHDGALVDVERHAAHVDAVEQIGRGLAGADAALDERGNPLLLRGGDRHAGAGVDVVGMNAERLADQKGRLRDRIGGAVSEHQFGSLEPQRGGTDQFGDASSRFGRDEAGLRRGARALRFFNGAPPPAGCRPPATTSHISPGLTLTKAAILSSTTRPRLCEALRSSSSPVLPNATRPV